MILPEKKGRLKLNNFKSNQKFDKENEMTEFLIVNLTYLCVICDKLRLESFAFVQC